jgi:hypothetical protein
MPQHRVLYIEYLVLYIEYLVLYIEYLVLYIEYLSVFFDGRIIFNKPSKTDNMLMYFQDFKKLNGKRMYLDLDEEKHIL